VVADRLHSDAATLFPHLGAVTAAFGSELDLGKLVSAGGHTVLSPQTGREAEDDSITEFADLVHLATDFSSALFLSEPEGVPVVPSAYFLGEGVHVSLGDARAVFS
jgi:hypothetical protein